MENCRGCWWYEGGKCYEGELKLDSKGSSMKPAKHICEKYWNKRKALLGVIPNDKLIILSESH